MKKLMALLVAFSMIFASLAGCGKADSESESVPESGEAAPVTLTAEGVVSGVADGEVTITLADGGSLTLDISGLSQLGVQPGDTIKAEYTASPDAAVASRVEVTAKAQASSQPEVEPVPVTVTGTVTQIDADMVIHLTLEDGSEAVLNGRSFQGLDCRVGDTIVIEYTDTGSGMKVTSLGIMPASGDQTGNSGASQTVPASQAPASSSGGTSSGGGSSSSRPTGGPYAGWNWDEIEFKEENDYVPVADVYEAVRLTNAERKKQGLPALDIDEDIMDMAAERAEELADYYSHTRPDGTECFTIFDENGWVYSSAAENIASGFPTSEDVIEGWMNSPGHRANILKNDVTKIGIGFYYDREHYRHYWAMLLAAPRGGSSGNSSQSGSGQSAGPGDVYEAVRLTNIERAKEGLYALDIDDTMMEMAAERARELVTLYSHTRPDGTDCFTVYGEYSWPFEVSAENIAMGFPTAEAVMEGWMNSPGHRANILKNTVTKIGIGCVYDAGTNKCYWAMLLAMPSQLTTHINIVREQLGLPKCKVDSKLTEIATARAREQARSPGHTRPDGSDYRTIFDEYGYDVSYSLESTFSGQDSSNSVLVDWMNSSEQNANILDENITKIGVGFYYSSGKYYWVMLGAD